MAVPREGCFPPVEPPPRSPSGASQEQWGYLILLLQESTCWSCRLGHTDGNLHLNFLPGFSRPQKQGAGWSLGQVHWKSLLWAGGRGAREGERGGLDSVLSKVQSSNSAILQVLPLGEVSFKQRPRLWKNWETSRKVSVGNSREAKPVDRVLFLSPKSKRVLCSHARGQMPCFPSKFLSSRELDMPEEGIPHLGTHAHFSTARASP